MKKFFLLMVLAAQLQAATPLAGTLSRTVDFYPGSGTINQMCGIVSNSTETTAYLADKARGEIRSLNLSTWTHAVLTSGLTSPVALSISSNNSTLYVLTDTGLILSIPTATGISTQIGTLNAVAATGWAYMRTDGTYLYIAGNNRNIYRFNLATNTSEVWEFIYYFTSALAFDPTFSYLYHFVSISGPNTAGPLVRTILATGRMEVVAGTSTNADANGEAFLAASFTLPTDCAVDTDGEIYCGSSSGATAKVRKISGGTVSTLYSASGVVNGTNRTHFCMLRASRKLLVTAGGTAMSVIQ